MTRIPRPEQKVSGSVDAAITSSHRLTAQKPFVSFHATGASLRKRA
jgi:hypothetical protein